MLKLPYSSLTTELDKLFFLPLAENESIQTRDCAINALLTSNGWTWDELINELAKSESN
jgi:hypothetical protein